MKIDYLSNHKDVVPLLAEWSYREWAFLHPEKTVKDVERLLNERTNTNKIPLALVALEKKEVVGMVSLKLHDMDTRQDLSPWLAGLYVSASWRRQGIGASLVSALESEARAMGVERLFLHTPKSEAFYSKMGWQIRERMIYHRYPVTLMQKEIC